MENINVLSEIDASYIAAFIDGEGYIGLPRVHRHDGSKTPTYSLKIEVCNNCLEILQWIMLTVGNGSIYRKNRGTSWAWIITNKKAATLLIQLLPYLKIKKLQAEVAIRFSTTIFYKYGSRNKLSQDIINKREQCRLEIIELNSKYRNHNQVIN